MGILISLVVIVGIVWLILAWTRTIPSVHVGVEDVLGNRFFFGRKKMTVHYEGFGFRILPYPLSTIQLISIAKDTDPFNVKAFTRYGRTPGTEKQEENPEGETAQVIFDLELFWTPYWRHPELFQRYFELSQEAAGIKKDKKDQDAAVKIATDAIEGLLGELTGQVSPADVIDKRKEFQLLLNAFTRAQRKEWDKFAEYFSEPEKQEGLLKGLKKLIRNLDEQNQTEDNLPLEIQLTEEKIEELKISISRIEELAGIKIYRVIVKEVRFTDETEQALQAKLQARREAEASEAVVDKLNEMEKSMNPDLPVKIRHRYAGMALKLPITETAVETTEGAPGPIVLAQPPTSKGKE